MRRIIVLLATLLFTLGLMAGPATAMQPPGQGQGVDDNFPCTEEGEMPFDVHPGAAGLADATLLAAGMTADAEPQIPHGFEMSLTAWNAAFIDNPVTSAQPCEE